MSTFKIRANISVQNWAYKGTLPVRLTLLERLVHFGQVLLRELVQLVWVRQLHVKPDATRTRRLTWAVWASELVNLLTHSRILQVITIHSD